MIYQKFRLTKSPTSASHETLAVILKKISRIKLEQTEIIISINELALSELCAYEVTPDFFLTNNKKILENITNNFSTISIIGFNEINALQNKTCYFHYSKSLTNDISAFHDRSFLINHLVLIELFCQALWIIKDNSVYSEMGHLVYGDIADPFVHTNNWEHSFKNCFGTNETVEFTKTEIENSIIIFYKLFKISYAGKEIEQFAKITATSSRLSRALYFLESARITADIGVKIANYCTVLESIFSVSTTELRHRLSESVAHFIGTDKINKTEIYKTLQIAYDIRSSIVHGDGISAKFTKNNFELLKTTITKTDDILRKCFQKILNDETLIELFTKKSKEDINTFNQNQIFS